MPKEKLDKILKTVGNVKNQAGKVVSTVIDQSKGAADKLGQGLEITSKGVDLAAKGAKIAGKGGEILSHTLEKASAGIKGAGKKFQKEKKQG